MAHNQQIEQRATRALRTLGVKPIEFLSSNKREVSALVDGTSRQVTFAIRQTLDCKPTRFYDNAGLLVREFPAGDQGVIHVVTNPAQARSERRTEVKFIMI